MTPVFSLFLEAHNADKNHHRFYQIEVSKNLFSLWTVETRYGRTGTYGSAGGQRRLRVAESWEEAQSLVHRILKKRKSAIKRIGTNYLVTHQEGTLSLMMNY